MRPPDPGAPVLLAVALAVAAALLLWHIDLPLWGSEGRWLVVSREMQRAGDPFAMTIDGQPYVDKPFGSYWLVVGAARLLGGFTEAAGRLPGVLAYLGTLAITFLIGKRTLGARTGAVAALLLATSLRLLFWGRTASADPQSMFGIALALLLLLECSERGRLRTWLALGVVAAAATLMKGLIGVALPAFAALLWLGVVRGPRWLRERGVPAGAGAATAAFLACASTPFVMARFRDGDWEPLRLLWRESFVRAVDPFDHVRPWWFYLADQFELLSAWSVLLPAALLLAVARLGPDGGGHGLEDGVRRDDGGWRARLIGSSAARRRAFPLFGYVAVLLFLSLSRSRRSYYLMPVAPFAALLVAQVLLATPAGAVARLRRAGLAVLGGLGTIAGLAALVLGVLRLASDTAPGWLLARVPQAGEAWTSLPPWLALTAVAIVPAAALLFPRTSQPLWPTLAVLLQTAVLALGVVQPLQLASDPTPAFAAAVRQIVPAEQASGLTDGSDAKLLYYLDSPPAVADASRRWRLVHRKDLHALLLAEPDWVPCADPRLPADAWPADDADALLLLRRGKDAP